MIQYHYKTFYIIMRHVLINYLTLIALLVSSSSYAEYKIKVPLEIKDGGSLSNGSITIGNGNIDNQSPVSSKECHYDESIPPTNGYYMWVDKMGDLTNIWYSTQDDLVNDTGLYLGDIPNLNGSYQYNGYTYTRGSFVRSNSGLSYYQICRE